MLPSLKAHRVRHSVAVALVVTGMSVILTGLFLLYAGTPRLLESVLFITALCWGICYAAGRDIAGYWVYGAVAPKFFIPDDIRTASDDDLIAITKVVTARTRLLINTTVFAVLLVSAFLLADWLTDIPRAVLLGVTTVLAFPLLLARGLNQAVPFFVAVAALVGNPAAQDAIKPRTLRSVLLEDTGIALAINIAVILPLARRDVFSSGAGYTDPTFLLSCLSLMLIVTFSMLSGARRSRVQSVAGETISGQIGEQEEGGSPDEAHPRDRLYRMLQSFGIVAFWLLIMSLFFQRMDINVGFIPFYLTLVIPVVALYLLERKRTLRSDLTQSRRLLEHIRTSGQRPPLAKDL